MAIDYFTKDDVKMQVNTLQRQKPQNMATSALNELEVGVT